MTLSADQFSPMLPGMEHLQTVARQPAVDAGLQARQERMYRNRHRMQGNPHRAGDHAIPSERQSRRAILDDPGSYGIPHVGLSQQHPWVADAYKHFGAFERKEYQAMGTTKLYARGDIETTQAGVVRQRVSQIRGNPAAGQGERTPGFIQGIEHGGKAILTNGNHRAAADMANGALFVPVRTVPARSAPGLARVYRENSKNNQKKAKAGRKQALARQVNGLIDQLRG